MSIPPVTFLCLASYFKGTTFLKAAKNQGCRVLLLTREKLKEEAWPWESIDEVFYMPSLSKRPDMIHAVSYLMRSYAIDKIVPLDDYDVETAASLREHLRVSGMGESTSRYFRDKLAMRMKAQEAGLNVPAFSAVFHYAHLQDFMNKIPPPWLLKPRSEAGAMGIKRVNNQQEVWDWLNKLGDEQSFFLIEQFIYGEVFHVDSIVWEGQVLFAAPHQYGRPPINVAHDGGVFVTRSLPPDHKDAQQLLDFNEKLLKAFGLVRGVTHAEYIKGKDGRFYFVEVAARVGGANIEQLVEASSGINLWGEWAKLEAAHTQKRSYQLPQITHNYAGVLICLARQEFPDLSSYQDPEIVYRVDKKQHAGLVVASPDINRLETLVNRYTQRFVEDFLAVAPPLDKPPT